MVPAAYEIAHRASCACSRLWLLIWRVLVLWAGTSPVDLHHDAIDDMVC